MIQCLDCGLPTSPAILFFENFLNRPMPCFCGSAARVRVGNEKIAPVKILRLEEDEEALFELYTQMRADDDGMPEKSFKAKIIEPRLTVSAPERKAVPVSSPSTFGSWLITRGQQDLLKTAANRQGGVVMKIKFRRERGRTKKIGLKDIFAKCSEYRPLTNPADPPIFIDTSNPYMEGMETLAAMFE